MVNKLNNLKYEKNTNRRCKQSMNHKMNPNAFSKSEPASTEKYPGPIREKFPARTSGNSFSHGESHTNAVYFLSVFEGRPDLLAGGSISSILIFRITQDVPHETERGL